MIRRSIGGAILAVAWSRCFRGLTAQYDSCTNGTITDIGNGRCDVALNNPSCGFDGGDCCACTCADTLLYSCNDTEFDCLYPDCRDDPAAIADETTCDEELLGNGYCDYEVNLSSCGYDGGDCCECSCADGQSFACGSNGFACEDPTCFDPVLVADFPDCTGDWSLMGDGSCNSENNNAACDYDGGDCCLCSCSGTACAGYSFDCLDPDAGDEIYGCSLSPPTAPPCSADVQRTWVVETSAHAQALTAAVNCSGGSFEVEWSGRIVMEEPLHVVDGTILTLAGVDSSAVIDGNGSTRLFTVVNASLHLSDVNISSGASNLGGAIAAVGSSVTLNRTNFVGNLAVTGLGGAVYVSSSSMSCAGGGTFANNAALDGGALFVTDASVVSCGGSWTNNTAVYGGAAVVLGSSRMLWGEEAAFAGNSAGTRGGAIFVSGGSSLSWDSATTYDSNTAGLGGGALFVESDSRVFWSGVTTLAHNSAGYGGALIIIRSSNASWGGFTTFLGNEAIISGGAVYTSDNSNISWSGTESVFHENRAERVGGAVMVTTASQLSCDEQAISKFSFNSAVREGGALYVESGSSISLVGNTSFEGNNALGDPENLKTTGLGGAASIAFDAAVTWGGITVFTANRARYGACLFASFSSSVHDLGHTTATGNIADMTGGAFYVTNSSVRWAGQTDIYNNSAEGDCAGVFLVDSATVVVDGTMTLEDNRAGHDSWGGALSLHNGSKISWSGVATFSNNSATRGGAILMIDSEAQWTGDTVFSGNHAADADDSTGGAIALYESEAQWTGDTVFSGNNAPYGGAIALYESEALWTGDTVFSGNYASYGGGAIYLDDGNASWSGLTKFIRNSAENPGGALFAWGSQVSWSVATWFEGNNASTGGALCIIEGSNVTWTGETEFASNHAREDGGAIWSIGSESTDRDSYVAMNGSTTFLNNTAEANGGALALLGGLVVDIIAENVSFAGNTADVAGGAMFVSGMGFGPVFTGVSFISNSAQVGGAVSVVGSGGLKEGADDVLPNPTTFDRCRFVDNRGTATGGAIDTAAGQDAFVNSIFRGNKAGIGGALRLAGTASTENCSFVDNISDFGGGAAVSNIGFMWKMQNISFMGNVFDCDPGMFLDYNSSGDPYEAACDGCQTACDGCFFEEPPLVPVCTDVMDHAISAGGTVTKEMLTIEHGYWRATPSSINVLACYHADACVGGVTGTAGYCLGGYEGPYCAVCSEGYTAGLTFTCSKCSDSAGGIVLAAILAVVGLCVAVALVSYVMSGEVGGMGAGMVERLGRYVPLQSLKIVIVVWQILTQFTTVANVTYPDVYERFLDGLDVFNFDLGWVLSVGCVFDVDFHDRLLISTGGPILIVLLLTGTYATAARTNCGATEALQYIWNKHMSMLLLLTFLVYSSVSSVIFKTFACEDLDDGQNYLTADYRIECDSPKHKAFQVYAGFMFGLYVVGIPALYGFLLFRDREVLRQNGGDRQEHARVTSISDLWKPYRPSVFYYEVIECGRRILLAGLVVFVYPNTAAQIAIAMMLAFVFVMISEVLAPHVSKWDTWISRIGHVVVFVSMFVALLLKVDVSDERAGSQRVFEIVLVTVHACMILAVVVETLLLAWSLRVEQREEPLARFGGGRLVPSKRSVTPDSFSDHLKEMEVSHFD